MEQKNARTLNVEHLYIQIIYSQILEYNSLTKQQNRKINVFFILHYFVWLQCTGTLMNGDDDDGRVR